MVTYIIKFVRFDTSQLMVQEASHIASNADIIIRLLLCPLLLTQSSCNYEFNKNKKNRKQVSLPKICGMYHMWLAHLMTYMSVNHKASDSANNGDIDIRNYSIRHIANDGTRFEPCCQKCRDLHKDFFVCDYWHSSAATAKLSRKRRWKTHSRGVVGLESKTGEDDSKVKIKRRPFFMEIILRKMSSTFLTPSPVGLFEIGDPHLPSQLSWSPPMMVALKPPQTKTPVPIDTTKTAALVGECTSSSSIWNKSQVKETTPSSSRR